MLYCLLYLHWLDACHPSQYMLVWTSELQVRTWCPNFWQLKNYWGPFTKGLILKPPHPLVNLTGCYFPASTTFTMSVLIAIYLVSLFHLVIRLASIITSACGRRSSPRYARWDTPQYVGLLEDRFQASKGALFPV